MTYKQNSESYSIDTNWETAVSPPNIFQSFPISTRPAPLDFPTRPVLDPCSIAPVLDRLVPRPRRAGHLHGFLG